MGEDPQVIRQEIESTRERMGETVDALGYKADVPSRAKEAAGERVQSVKDAITGVVGTAQDKAGGAVGSVSDATPGAGDIKQGAKRSYGLAQENPLGLAIGSIAVGFVAGMLVPSTRIEQEKLGPVADQVKETARQTGQEVVEHGTQVVKDVANTAQESIQQVKDDVAETAQSSAQEHGQQVKESAQGSAEQVRSTV